MIKDLLLQIEINQDIEELKELELTEEELIGYLDFFIETWFPEDKLKDLIIYN